MRYKKNNVEVIDGYKLVMTEPYDDDGQEVTVYGETLREIADKAPVEMASLRSQIITFLYRAAWIVWDGKIVVMEQTPVDDKVCMKLVTEIRSSEAYDKAVTERKERDRQYAEKKKAEAALTARQIRSRTYEELKKEFS